MDPSRGTWRTGHWEGFYLQDGDRHRQTLELAFAQGKMSGTGDDPIGPFVILGEYDEEENSVAWVKQYLERHQVYYSGQMSNGRISGAWIIINYGRYLSDRFELWPRSLQ